MADSPSEFSVGSIKSDSCLILYNLRDCKSLFDPPLFIQLLFERGSNPRTDPPGWLDDLLPYAGAVSAPFQSFRVDGNVPDLKALIRENATYISSFQPCNYVDGGSMLNVDLYDGSTLEFPLSAPIIKARGLCGCIPLPAKDLIIDNHGNDILLFESENCKGPSRFLRGGASLNAMGLWEDGQRKPSVIMNKPSTKIYRLIHGLDEIFGMFENQWQLENWGNNAVHFRSYRNMQEIPSCIRLEATISKFRFKNGAVPNADGFNKSSETWTKFLDDVKLTNSGATPITLLHTAYMNFTAKLQFTIPTGLTKFYSVKVGSNIEVETDTGIRFEYIDLLPSLLSGTYEWPGNGTNMTVVVNQEIVTYERFIAIPPFSECNISSWVQRTENFPLNYTAFANAEGHQEDMKMFPTDIRDYLPNDVEIIDHHDIFITEIMVNGTLNVDLGSRAVAELICNKTQNGPDIDTFFDPQDAEKKKLGNITTYVFDLPIIKTGK